MARFIVFDGSDGSGKKTQREILEKRLRQEGITFETADFPRHNTPAGYFVDKYLNDDYGPPKDLGANIPSVLFAVDRFDDSARLKDIIANKDIKLLISDRYVSANCGHQGGKIIDKLERQKFLDWLFEFEYEIMRIPRPDLTLFLHVPVDVAQKLIDKKDRSTREYIKDKKRDAHEADIEHLKGAVDAFKYCARKFSDWKQIDCYVNGRLLTVEEVHEKIWKIVKQYV